MLSQITAYTTKTLQGGKEVETFAEQEVGDELNEPKTTRLTRRLGEGFDDAELHRVDLEDAIDTSSRDIRCEWDLFFRLIRVSRNILTDWADFCLVFVGLHSYFYVTSLQKRPAPQPPSNTRHNDPSAQ